MEEKIIGLDKGIHRQPTVAENGQLTDCVNLIARNGQLVNAPVMEDAESEEYGECLSATAVLKYQHVTSSGKVNIVENANALKYINTSKALVTLLAYNSGETLKKVSAVGNTLVVLTSEKVWYALWENEKYTVLGSHIPEIDVRFGLNSVSPSKYEEGFRGYPNRRSMYNTREYLKNNMYASGDDYVIDGDKIAEYMTAFNADIVKIIKDIKRNNKFFAPFLARYAYEMYDGTYTMASSPVLMVPNSGITPQGILDDPDPTYGRYCHTETMECYINIKASKSKVEELGKWKDIVKGIVVFVSDQFLRYEQEGIYWQVSRDYASFPGRDNSYSYKVYTAADDGDKFYPEIIDIVTRSKGKKGQPFVYGKIRDIYDDSLWTAGSYMLLMPQKSNDEYEQEIKNCSSFYKIKSYGVEDIPCEDWEYMILEDGTLENLTTREMLKYDNDYQSHDTVSGQTMFVYNNRVNLGNITRKMFDGHKPDCALQYTNGVKASATSEAVENVSKVKTYIYVNYQGKIVRLEGQEGEMCGEGIGEMFYYYYPNPNAVLLEMEITKNGATRRVYIKMETHPTMNGSLAFVGLDKDAMESIEGVITADGMNEFHYPNKVYTTPVGNPYVFDVRNINTIGNGDVKAVCVNTTSLSQGQFGQHPLLAFATDGIWALTVNSEGGYSAVQPLSREVLLEGTSPLQTDDAIVFASESGLKMLVGNAQITNIGKALEGILENGLMQHAPARWSALVNTENKTLREICASGKMLHDAANGLLRVFTSNLQYVFDYGSQEWTRAVAQMPDAIVSGYPSSLMQYGSTVKRYSKTSDSTTHRLGLLLTREMAFDNPLAMKMLRDLRVMRKQEWYTSEGVKQRTAQVVVLVSNDRVQWHKLDSMSKHSFKWYRFIVCTDLTDMDGLEGIVCRVETRRANKIR